MKSSLNSFIFTLAVLLSVSTLSACNTDGNSEADCDNATAQLNAALTASNQANLNLTNADQAALVNSRTDCLNK